MPSEGTLIGWRCQKSAVRQGRLKGLTLVELLVVISIISLLASVLLPAFSAVKRKARVMLGMNNQRQITGGVNLFALDHDDRYPDSVATVGFGSRWNWSDPTKLAGNRKRSPSLYRSMSAYLRAYLPDADSMYCPNAPRRYKYLEEAWNAGEDWDNPDTSFPSDPVGGTYCLYWNYVGFLGGRREVFVGPRGPAGGRGQSKLLLSDYFGYDHWRSPGAYGSCERFKGADIVRETWLLSAYWSCEAEDGAARPDITLRAGYTDGHVESYSASEVIPMKVSLSADGTVPYPDGVGPGVFYLPGGALH
jgi:prepilin-type N-terminal cleavage/methylation domain-containing protein